jgi:hypothetical protein
MKIGTYELLQKQNEWRVQAILSLFSIIELPNGALFCNLNFLCNFSRNFSSRAIKLSDGGYEMEKKRFYNDNKFEKRITIHFFALLLAVARFPLTFFNAVVATAKMELNRLCFVIVLLLSRQMTVFFSMLHIIVFFSVVVVDARKYFSIEEIRVFIYATQKR